MGIFDRFKKTKFDENGNKLCPNCQSPDILDIVYGYPSNDLIEDSYKGKVRLGGCCVDESNPNWQCELCNHRWK
jgi:hypothetical protein